jgi:hypothetical protein
VSDGHRDPGLVRAYVRARGRSRASRDLDLVTLVVVVGELEPGASPDERRVVALCGRRGALSIAEIAAYLDLPPSVVKIVASDLLDIGCLAIPAQPDVVSHAQLLEEVLNGLRALAV